MYAIVGHYAKGHIEEWQNTLVVTRFKRRAAKIAAQASLELTATGWYFDDIRGLDGVTRTVLVCPVTTTMEQAFPKMFKVWYTVEKR